MSMNSFQRLMIPIVACLAIGACGTSEDRVSTTPGAPASSQAAPSSIPDAGATTSERVGKLSAVLASSPHWAVTKRALPPDASEELSTARGYFVGRLVGIEPSPSDIVSAEDVLGVSSPLVEDDREGNPTDQAAPPTALQVDSVELIFDVDSSWSQPDTFGTTHERVAVPLVVAVGPSGTDNQKLLDELVTRMRSVAPLGAKALLLTEDVRDTKTPQIVTPGSRYFRAPLGVVFLTEDTGLASLDWLIGADASNYFSADSVAALEDRVAGR